MKINKISESNKVPDWLAPQSSPEAKPSSSDPIELSDDQLVVERERIEQCASSKTQYRYSSTWSDSSVASLKEYAVVCALPSTHFVKADVSSEVAAQVKTASASTPEADSAPKLDLGDVFHLDDIPDRNVDRNAWQKVNLAGKLTDQPSMMSNAVISIRSDESNLTNASRKNPTGTNSIWDSNAINTLATSDFKTAGEKVVDANKSKGDVRAKNLKAWEQEIVASMANKNAATGNIALSTGYASESSLGSSFLTNGGLFDKTASGAPDKTKGEMLADINRNRKDQIQRTKADEREWNKPQSSSKSQVSDIFAESLKAALAKQAEAKKEGAK